MLNLYTKTPIERWLENLYRENSILSPADLDIYVIAEALNIVIKDNPGPIVRYGMMIRVLQLFFYI